MSTASSALEFVREDDFIEYFLFPQLTNGCEDAEKTKNDLQNILQQVNQLIEDTNRKYIWHKDEFHLSLRTADKQLLIEENDGKKEILPPHLYGILHYGENIQDEWFCVFLLYEITRKISGVIARVIDSDGEFLLIEAADVLPKWANPDTCEQRVYIHDGHLQLVQNSPSNTSSILQISTAVNKIWQNPTLYRVSNDIQGCVSERLKDFQGDFKNFLHQQRVRVPLAIARILKEKPSLIAPACRAFCERDTIDMKACRAMRYFPPENRVKTSVTFTRCLYAMTTNNDYIPDRRTGWNLPAPGTEEYKEDLLGVKIACGFEILASQAKDTDDDIENDRSWKTYLNSLVKKGYFAENLEGSKDYCRLLNEAKLFYKENRDKFRTAPIVGKEIINLIRSIDVNAEQLKIDENNLSPSEDDSWLNISAEELDTMLAKKYGLKKLYQPNGNVNAAEFAGNITEFLEKESEYDGIDVTAEPPRPPKRKNVKKNQSMRKAVEDNPIDIVDDNSIDDNHDRRSSSASTKTSEINFDPDNFQTHVKNFLDLVIPEDNWESTSEMSDYEDDDDLDRNIEDMAINKSAIRTNLKKYMDQMDLELSKTTIGKSFKKSSKATDADDFDDIETFKPIDIDVNALRNMMDSYKSQIGGPGPASTLLGAMGSGMKQEEEKMPDVKGTQV